MCVIINTIVHPPFDWRTQVSRLGTESFILMELILASLLSCEYATGLVNAIHQQHTDTPKSELVQIVEQSTEIGCFEDVKVD